MFSSKNSLYTGITKKYRGNMMKKLMKDLLASTALAIAVCMATGCAQAVLDDVTESSIQEERVAQEERNESDESSEQEADFARCVHNGHGGWADGFGPSLGKFY